MVFPRVTMFAAGACASAVCGGRDGIVGATTWSRNVAIRSHVSRRGYIEEWVRYWCAPTAPGDGW